MARDAFLLGESGASHQRPSLEGRRRLASGLLLVAAACLAAAATRSLHEAALEQAPEVVYFRGGAAEQQRMLRERHMHIMWVPESELERAEGARIGQSLAGNATSSSASAAVGGGGGSTGGGSGAGGAGGASVAAPAPAGGKGGRVIPGAFYAHERESCAISNLVSRAELVLPAWDVCGYMAASGNSTNGTTKGASPFGTISAPSDDTACTQGKMGSSECREAFARSLANNDVKSLSDCMLWVRGLSQVCDLYSQCGPPTSSYSPSLAPTSVCQSAEGFYKEVAVERMCGVCGMFRATVPALSESRMRLARQEGTEGGDGGGGSGCFASIATVDVLRGGDVQRSAVGDVAVGDLVRDGHAFSRVYFVHDHRVHMRTVRLAWLGGSMELTPNHRVPVYSSECGVRVCSSAPSVPAGSLREGDAIYVVNAMGDGSAVRLAATSRSSARVRYILTESSTIAVGDSEHQSRAVASVCSTGACALETLPFRLLDGWLLQHPAVQAALRAALDSPLLSLFESSLGMGKPLRAPRPAGGSGFWDLGVLPLVGRYR